MLLQRQTQVIDELRLGTMVAAHKTWQLYRGICKGELVGVKVRLA